MKIAFIGSGCMAGAMMRGIISAGVLPSENIITINEAYPESAETCAAECGCIHGKPSDIAACDAVVFGVKPQTFAQALEMYGEYFTSDKLYMSIMAGVSTAKIESQLKTGRVIRFMPNLALSVGASATVYAMGSSADESDAAVAEELFSPMGIIKRVDEDMISAVTALSGSGPAYFCLLCEAMSSAAAEFGMDEDVASQLAIQTLIGTAELLKGTGVSPKDLRARVTSKKGTTEAAIDMMIGKGFCDVVSSGFDAARMRSDELGRES